MNVPKFPRWVTAKDFEIIHPNGLTIDKDYKVEGYEPSTGQFLIINDYGNTTIYHKSHFNNELSVGDIPEDVVEEEIFDNLTYITPEEDCYILFSHLSSEQKEWLLDKLEWGDASRFDWESGELFFCEAHWFTQKYDGEPLTSAGDHGYVKYSFNDLVISKV